MGEERMMKEKWQQCGKVCEMSQDLDGQNNCDVETGKWNVDFGRNWAGKGKAGNSKLAGADWSLEHWRSDRDVQIVNHERALR